MLNKRFSGGTPPKYCKGSLKVVDMAEKRANRADGLMLDLGPHLRRVDDLHGGRSRQIGVLAILREELRQKGEGDQYRVVLGLHLPDGELTAGGTPS